MKLLKQLQQLAPLAAQATAGPWEVIPNSEYTDSVHSHEANHTENFGLGNFRSSNLCMNSGGFAHDADAAFIAAARNLLTPENLTLLVAALQAPRTAQKDLDALRSMLCGISVVGGIDGWPVIRRDSVIELTDQFRHV